MNEARQTERLRGEESDESEESLALAIALARHCSAGLPSQLYEGLAVEVGRCEATCCSATSRPASFRLIS